MKRILLSLAVLSTVTVYIAAQGQPDLQNPGAKAVAQWITNDTIDMGQLTQGNPEKVNFRFKNTGNAPLVITNVAPTCGCTNVNWTREPVKPGEEGFIETTYNSASLGNFFKTVKVSWNAEPAMKVLVLKGSVQAKQ